MSRTGWLVAASGFACALACIGSGCVIVTGGTDGYQLQDSGSQSSGDGATCNEEGGCLDIACLGAGECDGGNVCCLTLAGDSLISTCQAGPCKVAQLCTSASECGSNGACTASTCNANGVGITFQSCGAIPGCAQ